jgi:iron complex outermembrane receptor protein
MTTRHNTFLGSCALFAAVAAQSVWAQETPQSTGSTTADEIEIIVTARRRAETAQETPVPLTVLSQEVLERYNVKGVHQIVNLTPGLVTSEASGAMGGTISLRGVGSGDSMAFIDQAVSANVDGVPISTAQILRAAQLDLKQIEVLRGPQALFFGKNSPGGIISITTSDPGDTTELMARGGYEFVANETYGEFMVSQPVSDTLGVRIAARYGEMDGYVRVISPDVPGTIPMDINRFPHQDELFLRGTVAWQPTDALSATLKFTYADTDTIGGSSQYSDIVACPYGVPQRPYEDAFNCRNDRKILLTQLPPQFMALSDYLENPNGNRNNTQMLFSGTVNYDINDALTLTSVSGYYDVDEDLTSNGGYGPISNNGFAVRFRNKQYTQELRLGSDFDRPLNFLVGAFYEHRDLYTLTMIGVPQFLLRLPIESTNQDQDSYSAFGQVMWRPTDRIELTAGGRYTHEVKKLNDYTVQPVVAGQYAAPVDVTQDPRYGDTKLKFNNFSPEVTAVYKATDDMMLFASYKRGFKSGGFDAGYTNGGILTNPERSQEFDPEKVKGFELGMKSNLLSRQMIFNVTGYWYDYNGLQVSVFDTSARAFRLQNAAKARVRGIEIETRFRPDAVPGLALHASAAYNDAKYREYFAACYQGQTVELGCAFNFNPAAGVFTAQDLSGERLRKAPEFTATAGAYYEFPIADLMMSLSADALYSDGYNFGTQHQPTAYQDPFTKIDATIRLFTPDKRWELALIGRNLTDKLNLVNGIDRTGTGSGRGSTLPSCTAAGQTGCAALSDLIGTAALPRSVALQLTYRY